MFTRSHSLKGIASLGSTAIAIILVSSCSGAGFGPTESRGTTPDLVVAAPSVSDSGPVAGIQFTMWTTVRNVGDGAAAATRLRYYRSTDATITAADTEVGTVAVTGLADSNSTRESVDLTAPSAAGTYYYGACVDAVTEESDTTNNCSSSVRVNVAEQSVLRGQSDLVVVSPSVSDSSPNADTTFTLSATVRNDGAGGSEATTLRYYRSTDGTITSSDMEVGTDQVAGLAASGTSSQSVELAAPMMPGTYYLGACADAVADELDTANNCSASVQMMVPEPDRPDLIVTAPSVTDSGPTPGATFTLSATVRNNGVGSSEATTLRYYRSTDATITSFDMEVGTDEVAGLAASGTSSQSLELSAPATPGTYYFGVCVDAVVDELDTTNNCSTSVEVTVPVPERPDLMVTAPSVTDSAPAAGATFTLSATVRNDGEGGSEATTLRYYRSTDATITTSDTEVGTATVAELAASGSASESVALTAPSTPGTYYYGACVDTVTEESDTTNNCSASVQVMVPEPELHPDLVVASISVSDGAPVVGATFTLSATVRNDGKGGSERTTLRYYQSRDARITTSDTEVSTDAMAELAALGSASGSAELTAPANAGTYYFGVCVDAVTDESDTTNNCSTSIQVTVQATVTEPQGHPDLMVGTPSVSDNGPAAGTSFTLSATVRNNGEGSSEATTLRYYRSTDAIITTSDTEVGTDAVAGLAAAGSSSQSVDLTAPSSPGRYYYGACVDAVTDESDTANNCSASVQVTVPEPKYPDLMVGTPSVSDNGPAAGATFTLSATVRNDGDEAAVATTLRYYRSIDATITTSDTEVGTDAVAGLAAAGTSDQSVDLTAPSSPGTYYYGACVDTVTDESDTTNNCSSSVTVTVTVPEPDKPDLVVAVPTVNDSGPAAGATFTLSATVRNDGDEAAVATTLRYYRSADATITASDTEVGTDAVAGLAAAGTSDQSVDLTAPSSPGTYYYGACVDAVTDESDTTNNCSTSVQVTVPQPKPDLVVSSPSVDDDEPAAEATFTLSATVKNEGGGAAAATTLRYYRSTDAMIATSDTQVGTDTVAGLTAAGTSDQSVDLTAPATSGTYYYGACVDAVTDESDTTNNCSTSVAVTVPEAEQSEPSVEVSAEDDKEWAPVGDTVDLSVRVLDDEGEEISGTTVTWSSSHTAVATVDSSGVMTAVGEGTTTLTATATVSSSSRQSVTARSRVSGGAVVNSEEAIFGSIVMEVVKRAARIEVSPDSLSFIEAGEGWVGSLKSLTATVYDADDNVMQPTYWAWSSSDEEVVTVRPFRAGEAFVQAIWIGTATVTVTANASATVTVSITVAVTLPSGRVQLEPRSLTFDALGDTKSVTVRIFDEDGEEDEDAWFSFYYFFTLSTGGRIGDGGLDITKVDGGLEITANETGAATVEVFARVHSFGLKVTVNQKPASLEVSPGSASVAVGGATTLTARVKDSNGHDIQLASGDQEGLVVSWATSDSDVATVDGADDSTEAETGATATVAAAGAGIATITASWGSGSDRVTGTATITVTESN